EFGRRSSSRNTFLAATSVAVGRILSYSYLHRLLGSSSACPRAVAGSRRRRAPVADAFVARRTGNGSSRLIVCSALFSPKFFAAPRTDCVSRTTHLGGRACAIAAGSV